MILHSREDWLQRTWIGGSPNFQANQVDHMTCHYMGGNNIDCSDSIRLLNNMQSDYVRNRGYDLGYSFSIDQWGVIWEIRGFRVRAASDGTSITNAQTVSCLAMLPNMNSDLTSVMIQAYRDLMAYTRDKCKGAQHWIKHGDVYPTSCCGVPIGARVDAGELEPIDAPVIKPPPGGSELTLALIIVDDAYAKFAGDMDSQGVVNTVRYMGPRLNGIIGFQDDNVTPRLKGTQVLHRKQSGMTDFTLDGPLPHGDKVTWTASNFYQGD